MNRKSIVLLVVFCLAGDWALVARVVVHYKSCVSHSEVRRRVAEAERAAGVMAATPGLLVETSAMQVGTEKTSCVYVSIAFSPR